MRLSGLNAQTFQIIYSKMHETSDTSDWYFTGEIILRKNNFRIVERSKKGSGVNLLKKIYEYIGENCYIPTDCYCFIKCVNYITNTDLTKEFQDFINSFQKSNRKGVMTTARISKFNKKFNTNFQIYNPKDSHFQPKKVLEEFDWVFYLHKEHFCLIRRNNKALGIKEIEDNYDENVWRTCKDDDAVMCFAQLKLNVFSTISDNSLYAWDCETYCEKETNKAIPYCSVLTTGLHFKALIKLTQCPLVVDNKILSLPLSNPYTEERLQKKWKRQKEIMRNSNYLQNISFTCSFKHHSTSLATWGNSSNLPMNLRKIADINIAKFTKETWESLRPEWETYAKRDTLCLGACLIKYNQAMKKTVFQNVSHNLTSPSLSLKGWYYLYHYNKEIVEEEWYETTRMVPKHTQKENVQKVYSHTHPFIRYFIRQSIKGGRVSANRKSFETDKMNEICAILKEYNESDTEGIIDLFKEYSVNPKDKTEVHAKLKELDYSKLMAFYANGLYAPAMTEGEYPKAESARPFRLEENEKFVKFFNEQKFRPRTAILKVWFKYPTNMFFQPIPAKDKITFTNRIGKKETGSKIRFRNGFCHDVLTSVDIQEIVKSGGKIIKILDGIV
ncbi:hypothetical protein LOTGIDRAFT_161983 [Lottia gigantea]|uniref:DNA-directed DNA polymerase n=1 Tax=Lottia gigantea TaxID=225164 RepID=V4A9K0_LOTGI|nr:hypothetical protein LOTGIDRAFT_161983 [Lottia gigantea]ESO93412.1 hypothetical protein LOTGIDRAFT_161983 [Lottia gigantea]